MTLHRSRREMVYGAYFIEDVKSPNLEHPIVYANKIMINMVLFLSHKCTLIVLMMVSRTTRRLLFSQVHNLKQHAYLP